MYLSEFELYKLQMKRIQLEARMLKNQLALMEQEEQITIDHICKVRNHIIFDIGVILTGLMAIALLVRL